MEFANNCTVLYFDTGEEATRLIVDEGRKVGMGLQGQERVSLMRACDDVEMLTNQLAELCHMGKVGGSERRSIIGSPRSMLQYNRMNVLL